jgi:hypothetical protein
VKKHALGTIAMGLGVAALTAVSIDAHITPVVVMRKQADVIRAALPNAAKYTATTVRIGKPQLEQIVDRAHFTPDTDQVKFYAGLDASGRTLGTVLFPQVDTQHGPIEVGVAIGPDGAVTHVMVTRATVEMKPWVLDVERSGVLDRLVGAKEGPAKPISDGTLSGMPGYIADTIATATYRALAFYTTLRA